MEFKIEDLGFVKTEFKDMYKIQTGTGYISVLVLEGMIRSVAFEILKDNQPEYYYTGLAQCTLCIVPNNKQNILEAVAEVSKGNNAPWVTLVNPMENPRLLMVK